MYVKMSKNLSDKYYQENEERMQKKLLKDIKIFLKKKKKQELYIKLSENVKQKLAEYRKKYCRMRKNALL